MYRIVVCPKCGWARAVEPRHTSATCAHCGRKISLKKTAPVAELEDYTEASQYVAALNAKLRGGIVRVEKKLSESRLLQMMLDFLEAEHSRDEIIRHFSRYTTESRLERTLEELLAAGRIIEIKPDVFRRC